MICSSMLAACCMDRVSRALVSTSYCFREHIGAGAYIVSPMGGWTGGWMGGCLTIVAVAQEGGVLGVSCVCFLCVFLEMWWVMYKCGGHVWNGDAIGYGLEVVGRVESLCLGFWI